MPYMLIIKFKVDDADQFLEKRREFAQIFRKREEESGFGFGEGELGYSFSTKNAVENAFKKLDMIGSDIDAVIEKY